MDNPPGRYLPTNFNIFDFFFGSQPTHSLVYNSNQNLNDKNFSNNLENSYFTGTTMVNNLINSSKMNLTEDSKLESEKSSSDEKKSNTRVTGMIGGVIDALTNIVSKITNFTSTVNRSLSVTVVPQESFPTEYVVRPLTDGEHFTTDDSTLMNTSKRYQNYIRRSHTIEAFNNLSQRISDDTNNYSMWGDNAHDYYYHQQMNASLLYSQHAPDVQLAIEENFKVNKEQLKPAPDSVQKMDNNQLNSQYIKDLAMAMEESLKTIKINYKPRESGFEKSETKMTTVTDNNLSKSDDAMESDNDCVDLSAEQIFETKSRLPKKRSNNRNAVAQTLGKNRRRIPLRKSTTTGQMKHRKEKSKNIIYSAIQNDLNTWEGTVVDSSADELCSIISSSDEDENRDDQKKCSLNFENYIIVEKCALGDPPIDNIIDTSAIKDVIDEKLTESFNHSNKRVPEDCQQIHLPESPVKSQDCLVRFNLEPTVHTIIKWDFAYRAARKGPWEQMARDRDRFRTRICSTGRVIEPVLATKHRDCVWRDRFAATD
ncbi:Similar to PPP1R15A: Protein phosphatase 1 regulatory subunit 15A (Homo sapiens) [Cotesia congregata]|uniref:Similar to PPP1R15A: Protein phosphatase 1 regulatory subunit 15A (Homo sapiens) n=1 Tax=Cotesia congregata TaxID=51543 RepID=A0A8J2MSP4_COTCN|nr:Similar to PPP1R15A: Protein phosphatase 1 regulatory subunit 15A (Homo sapiens) [Cotesia congregata]